MEEDSMLDSNVEEDEMTKRARGCHNLSRNRESNLIKNTNGVIGTNNTKASEFVKGCCSSLARKNHLQRINLVSVLAPFFFFTIHHIYK